MSTDGIDVDWDTERDINADLLWEVQKEEWPTSKYMTLPQVYAWCDRAKTAEGKAQRYMGISMALQYPVFVFYGLGDDVNVRGFRYGLDGHHYMSGFKSMGEE
jgi:hypothetical protein